jgi:hypothetical protein
MGLLENLLHEGLEGVFLAHLSEVNNDPELPRKAAEKLLTGQTCCNPQLIIGEQHQAGPVLAL